MSRFAGATDRFRALIQALESRQYLSATFATFAQERSVAERAEVFSVTQTANFGNGSNDIAAMSSAGPGAPGEIEIFMNDGKGNFTQSQTIVTGNNPTDMVITDINFDDKPDLVVVTEDKHVSIYLATGTGTFTTTPTSSVSVGTGVAATPCTLTVVDLTLNSNVPSVVVDDPSDNRAVIYTDSNGQLESLETFSASLPAGFVFERPSSTSPMYLIYPAPADGDLPAGYRLDIKQQLDNSIVFDPALNSNLSETDNDIFGVATDDHITNIVTGNFDSSPGVVITYAPNTGDGESTILCGNVVAGTEVTKVSTFQVNTGLIAGPAGDINGDGSDDLIIGSDVFLNNTGGNFTAQNADLSINTGVNHSTVIADFDGDGLNDIESSLALFTQTTGTLVNTPNIINAHILSSTLPSIFVPGDKGSVKVQLTNSTNATARGKVNFTVLTSPTGQIIDAAALIEPARSSAFPISIAAGKSVVVTVPFTIPGTLFPSFSTGQQSLVLEATAVSGIDPSLLAVIQTDATTRTLRYGFGTVGTRHNIRFTTKVNNATVTITGSGDVAGDLEPITANDALLEAVGKTGSVNITGPAGSITNDVNISGTISFNAPGMNFNGGLIGFDGSPARVVVGNMTGSAIIFNDTFTTPVRITGGIFTNSFIQAPGPIASLSLKSFVNTTGASLISATSLAKFTDAGNLNANMAIATSIGTLQVNGDISNSTILAGATFGTDNAPGGNNDTFAAGTISNLKIGGSLNSSLIAAGLQSNDDKFPITTNVTLLAGSKIGPITIGGILNASQILSIAEPQKVRIDRGNLTIDPTDPRFNLVAG